VALPILPECQEAGEYVIQTRFVLNEKTRWADAGYEVAFGEHIFNKGKRNVDIPNGKVNVVTGDFNIGMHTANVSALFSRESGTIVSLVYNGKEMRNKVRNIYSGELSQIMIAEITLHLNIASGLRQVLVRNVPV